MKTKILTLQNNMKHVISKSLIKKSIALLTVGVLFSFNVSAKLDGTPKTIAIKDANKTIKEHIKFPDFLNFAKEEKVNVVFTVNEAGNVNLVVVNTANDNLRKSIETQFAKLKLNNLKADNAYSVVFNFKTI